MSDDGLGGQEGLEFEELEVDHAFVRMGELVEELQAHPDSQVQDKVLELLDWVDGFHREAIMRIVSMLPMDALESLRQDPVVAHLFETYIDEEEEEPEDLAGALEEALDEIRPYVHSHGGEMEVVDVNIPLGAVKLKLMGSCHGCPSSELTLTQGVEKILKEKWPAFRKLEVEGEEDEEAKPKKLLQIQTLRKG